jgi:hypothetical protein
VPGPGGAAGQDEEQAVEKHEARGLPSRHPNHEVLGVGHDRDVRPQQAPEGLVDSGGDLGEVGEGRAVPCRHLNDAGGLASPEGAQPERGAGNQQGNHHEHEQARIAAGPEQQPQAGRSEDARRHEMRPQREAPEQAEERQGAAGPTGLVDLTTGPGGEEEHQPAEDEGRGIEGRGQGGEEDEVGR